jgi:hypothetical protein
VGDAFESVVAHWHASFVRSTKARGALARFGVDDPGVIKRARVGYVTGSLATALPSEGEVVDELKSLGVLDGRRQEKHTGKLVVPFERGGKLTGAACTIDLETGAETLLRKGKHLWGADTLSVFNAVVVTDTVLGALVLASKGLTNSAAFVGGVEDPEALPKGGLRRIFLAFGAGPAGDRRARAAAKALSATGAETMRVRWPEGVAGVLDYFSQSGFGGTKPTFEALLKKAESLSGGRKTEKGRVVTAKGGGYLIAFGETRYCLKGVKLASLEAHRPIVTVEAGGKSHTDRVDLYSARSRMGYAQDVSKLVGLLPEEVEGHLLSLADILEDMRARATSRPGTARKGTMSDEERTEALAFLKGPDLIERIAQDLDAMGTVGEREAKALAYLVATSRLLPSPLSLLIVSQTSSGKSHVVESVMELMPEEAVCHFTRLTAQSLYYLDEHSLRHKVLLVDEKAGSEADYSIRVLQSRRKLTLAVPVKDPATGMTKTVVFEIEGPVAYFSTSTTMGHTPDNLSRCFVSHLDESPEQTGRVLAWQRRARTLDGLKVAADREAILRRHVNAQRLLDPVRVIVPYADLLEFPAERVRARRDQERFLCLLETVAFLHQHQRERKIDIEGREYIEANVDDYRIAHELVSGPISDTLSEAPSPVRRFYARVVDMVNSGGKAGGKTSGKTGQFTRRDVREHTRMPNHVVKAHMRELEQLEWVEVERAPRGGRYYYALPERRPELGDGESGLLPPARLAELVAGT